MNEFHKVISDEAFTKEVNITEFAVLKDSTKEKQYSMCHYNTWPYPISILLDKYSKQFPDVEFYIEWFDDACFYGEELFKNGISDDAKSYSDTAEYNENDEENPYTFNFRHIKKVEWADSIPEKDIPKTGQ